MDIRRWGSFGLLVLCGIALCFSGCAAVWYRPAGSDGLGYDGKVLEDGTVMASFTGNKRNTLREVAQYALCRAAELVKEQGFALMTIVDHAADERRVHEGQTCTVNTFINQVKCRDDYNSSPTALIRVRGVAAGAESESEAISTTEQAARCSRSF